jgi:osmotically inducible lipoprotein OsmB
VRGTGRFTEMACGATVDSRRKVLAHTAVALRSAIHFKESAMNKVQRLATASLLAIGALSLGACSDMSRRDKDTAIGAGVGAVAGSVLSNGSAAGTVGGAAVGGVIGNQVGKDKK